MAPCTSLNATPSPAPSHQSTVKQTSLPSSHSTFPAELSPTPTSAPSLHNSCAPAHLIPIVHLTNSANIGFKVSQNSPTSLRNQNGQHSAFISSAPTPQQGFTVQTGPEILVPLKGAFPPPFSSTPGPSSRSSASVVPAEVRQRIKEILCQCGHGVWASALPKLYVDNYKTPFPEHILDNLSHLLSICRVDYPLPHDKTKVG